MSKASSEWDTHCHHSSRPSYADRWTDWQADWSPAGLSYSAINKQPDINNLTNYKSDSITYFGNYNMRRKEGVERISPSHFSRTFFRLFLTGRPQSEGSRRLQWHVCLSYVFLYLYVCAVVTSLYLFLPLDSVAWKVTLTGRGTHTHTYMLTHKHKLKGAFLLTMAAGCCFFIFPWWLSERVLNARFSTGAFFLQWHASVHVAL